MGYRGQNAYDDEMKRIDRERTPRRWRIFYAARAIFVLAVIPIVIGLLAWLNR